MNIKEKKKIFFHRIKRKNAIRMMDIPISDAENDDTEQENSMHNLG